MSKYYEDGSPVDTSIFKTVEVKQENRLGKQTEKVMGLAQQLHAIRQDNSSEPDWQGMMLQCTSGIEKMKIKEARQAYIDEQKHKANLEAQAATDGRVAAVKTMPNRNKAFWERLQREDGRVYWSVEAQRLMKNDRSAQGLNWYSKK